MRCTIEIFTSPTSQDYLTDRICKGIEIFTSPNSEDYLADERNKTCVENFTSPTLRKDQRKNQPTPRPMNGGRVLTALSFENFKSPGTGGLVRKDQRKKQPTPRPKRGRALTA